MLTLEWPSSKGLSHPEDNHVKPLSQFFDYLIGVAEIEGSTFLILVSSSEPVINFDNLVVSKIKDIHFQTLKETQLSHESSSKLKLKEETNRLKRLFCKHGYYARGSNLSNTFIDALKDFYGVPDEEGINRGVLKGLAGFINPSNLDRYRRKDFSANYGLITCIETIMKKQLWMFDVVLVGSPYRGLCRQSHNP